MQFGGEVARRGGEDRDHGGQRAYLRTTRVLPTQP